MGLPLTLRSSEHWPNFAPPSTRLASRGAQPTLLAASLMSIVYICHLPRASCCTDCLASCIRKVVHKLNFNIV